LRAGASSERFGLQFLLRLVQVLPVLTGVLLVGRFGAKKRLA